MDTFWNRGRIKRKKLEEKEEINNRLIKDIIIRDLRTLFEQQEEDYYKFKRLQIFWNNSYIEYESSGDKR